MSTGKTVLAAALVLGLAFGSVAAWAGPRLVRVYVKSDDEAARLAAMDLDVASSLRGSHIDVVADGDELYRIHAGGFRTDILIDDLQAYMDSILGDGMGAYHTYSEMTEELHTVARLHPDIARVDSIGRTYENRAIWAIKISDNPEIDDPAEKDVMFVGLHHAREIATPEVVLYLMNYLIDRYGIDPRVTRLVNEREIWIIPMLNPDGHVFVENGDYFWRKNRRPTNIGNCIGVDPNRNYGFMWGIDDIGSSGNACAEDYRGPNPFSEYETQAIRDFVMSGLHDFTIAASYHSYGRLVLYPWGYTPELAPDHDTLAALADSMTAFNGYTAGPGYTAIYPTNGDFDDWMYGDVVTSGQIGDKQPPKPKDRILSFTFEVGGGFGPPQELIPSLCRENLEPNLVLIEYADDPDRVWPPETPVMETPVALDNGAWELRWSASSQDPSNAPVAFDVERAADPAVSLDAMEGGLEYWEGDGFQVSQDRSHSGSHSLMAGDKPDTRGSITPVYALRPAVGDSLTFWCWYALQSGDVFFVEVSQDGGKSYSMLSGSLTGADGNPEHTAGLLTGDSGGWVRGAFALDAFAGEEILYRLRCVTGSREPKQGIFLDDVAPVITFRERTIVAKGLTSGMYTPVPSPNEPLLFRARAIDADGHQSHWSSAVTIPVSHIAISRVTATPNPFSSFTRISFTAGDGLSVAGMIPVKLQIFDAAGRLVRTLLQEEVSVDRFHEKAWDRTADDGRRAPSGIYFVVLTARGQKFAQKVVLISAS
jgi:carboxypeptidase T